MPPPLIVMVAVRLELDVFAVTLTVIVALFDPDDLLTVHQLLLLDTVHDKLEEIEKFLFPLEGSKDKLVGSTLR